MREVYLDNSATTRPCEEAVQKTAQMMTVTYGNPSSLHTMGIRAQEEIDAARHAIAETLLCREDELYFTSGGTEANNLALFGAANAKRRLGNRIVVSAVEHSSIIESARELARQGFEVVWLAPDGSGVIPEEEIFRAVDEKTILVSMQMVNNEVGAIQPVSALARAVRRAKAPAFVHVDAVQAYGKLPVSPQKIGADLLTVSAHKVYGPKGVGALYAAKGCRILPRQFGGEQEKRLRPGTQAVPLIAGFGAAVQNMTPPEAATRHAQALCEECRRQLREFAGDVIINSGKDALAFILNFSVLGLRSETLLHYFASRGVYVSSGSACAKGQKSHVLTAMGLDPDRIDSAIRVSFGRYNTKEDIDQLIDALREALRTLTRKSIRQGGKGWAGK